MNYSINDLGVLELSFKEREPWDSSIESSLIESVEYWKKYSRLHDWGKTGELLTY